MFAGTAAGQLLPLYVVYKSEAMWDMWRQGGPSNCRYNRSKCGWFDSVCFHDWFKTVIFTMEVLQACEKHKIAFVCLLT